MMTGKYSVIGGALGLLASTALLAQPGDLIDLAQLGERGVAFETVGKGSRAVKSCAGVGDFNGDGFSDLAIIGFVANSFDRPPYVPAKVYVVYGRPGLTGQHKLDASLPGLLALGTLDYEQTRLDPTRVHPLGDIDHDGLADLLLPFSSQHPAGPGLSSGFALVLNGDPVISGERNLDEIGEGGIRGTRLVSSDLSMGFFGYAGASAGDFNGDGAPDLAISAAMPETRWRSLVLVLFESRGMTSTVDAGGVGTTLPGVLLQFPSNGAYPAPAGDVNGDGNGDLLVGNSSFLFLVYGRTEFPPVLDVAAAALEPGDDALRELGAVVITGPLNQERLEFGGEGQAAGVGDFDQDGFDDFLVGAAYAGIFVPGEVPRKQSVAYLCYGGPSLPQRLKFDEMPPGVARRITSGEEQSFGTWFANTVAAAGDVDGDGRPDLAIGEPKATVRGRANAGAVHVLHGGERTTEDLVLPGGSAGMLIQGQTSSDFLGTYVSPAGDFNGDGAQDLLVAAPVVVGGVSEVGGRAYLILGSGGKGPPLTALGVDPTAGSLRGGTRVRLSGSGFAPGLKVTFGAAAARSVSVLSSTEAVAETPGAASLGPVPVEVELNGVRLRLGEPFHYVLVHPDIDLAAPGRHGLRVDGKLGSELGHSLGLADVTGDGAADLLIGSVLGEDWVLSIVRGGSDLPESLEAIEPSGRVGLIRGPLPTGRRRSVDTSGLGDIDGDGIGDLGIGASDGLSCVHFGRSEFTGDTDSELALDAGEGFRLETPFLSYGRFSFAPLGDFDGDGTDDFALGLSAGFSSDPAPGDGQLVLIPGRRTWPQALDLNEDANVLTRITSGDPDFAREVAVLGDVDGDGRPDLLANRGRIEGGRKLAYLFRGGAILAAEKSLEERIAAGGVIVLGASEITNTISLHVAGPGDVNGDGFADILVANETGGELNQGVTYLIHGRPDLPAEIALEDPGFPVVRILGPGNLVQSGRALGPAGDFSGDGHPDFIIGAQNPDPFSPGTLSITYGGPELPAMLDLRRLGPHGLTLRGIQPITLLKTSTRQPGDFNADGRPDFAFSEMGSPDFYRDVVPSPGAVHVVFGLPESYPFVRGDATFDGEINISDAIYILTYLFVGSLGPECEDAADADDDGQLLITDAIYLLSSLFLGGPPPTAPFPEAGLDPTEDRLGCRGY